MENETININNEEQSTDNLNDFGGSSKNDSQSNYSVTLLLALFLGSLGAHRFYNKKIGTGIAMILTCGGFGIWTLVDFILIITGNFKDKNGDKIRWKEDKFYKNPANLFAIILLAINFILSVIFGSVIIDDLIDYYEDEFYFQQSTYNDNNYSNTNSNNNNVNSADVETAAQVAQTSLSVIPYSKSGLVSSLEMAGYTTDTATQAVDSLNIDWKEQALNYAKVCIDTNPESTQVEVSETLTYVGFTNEEVEYAISALALQ